MNERSFKPMTVYASIPIDYDTDLLTEVQLSELCTDCLISNVHYLSVHLPQKIPRSIYNRLMERALAANRVLSVTFLFKSYPYEEFLLPLPVQLSNWSALNTKILKATDNLLRVVMNNANIVVDVLRKMVTCNSQLDSSKLCIVDLNTFPLGENLVRPLCWFMDDIEVWKKSKTLANKQFVLKVSLSLKTEEELSNVCRFLKSKYLKILITGLEIYSFNFISVTIGDVLLQMPCSDLLYLSVEYITNNLFTIIDLLPKFKNLQTLNLTYILHTTNGPNRLDKLASVLHELPHLVRLGLRGSNLTGCLRKLFFKNCKKNLSITKKQKTEFDPKCCILHQGKLEYLDLSGCFLNDKDLLCLEEYPSNHSFMYLNLSYNRVKASILARSLEHISSSVVVLDLEASVTLLSPMEPFFAMIEKFKAVKLLNMKNIRIQPQHLPTLKSVILNMPSLKCIQLSHPNDALDDVFLEFKISIEFESERISVEISKFL